MSLPMQTIHCFVDVSCRLLAIFAFTDAGGAVFINTMILGSVGQLKGIEAVAHGKGVILDITLVARRSTERIGTRHWRRGIDMQVK